ncbi:lytic transglycosylase domain-containing protein [uncultured Enterovirga sp.]|uniref:lytic transglycosylase domain-containing protein n=1 Tax=uncultured Enterovirga sp. TaxID=2026352 RepID=UPI0035CABA01
MRLTSRLLGAAQLAASLASTAQAGDVPLPPPRPAGLVPASTDVVSAPAAQGEAVPSGRDLYLPLLTAEAKARGLPPDVADAVARIESGYRSGAVGGDGERGMMQVMPPTAAMLGFRGSLAELAKPETNIRLGVAYLAGAWRAADGDLCRALMKYRAGHNQERMSALSVEYCRRAKVHLASIGSPLAAGALPAAEFGTVPATDPQTPFSGLSRTWSAQGLARRGRRLVVVDRGRFWASHRARMKAIEARLHWRRGGILAGT